jgi:hypothetical protein
LTVFYGGFLPKCTTPIYIFRLTKPARNFSG